MGQLAGKKRLKAKLVNREMVGYKTQRRGKKKENGGPESAGFSAQVERGRPRASTVQFLIAHTHTETIINAL